MARDERLVRDSALVIDDDLDFCELVRFVGEARGVRVVSAHDCEEGIAILDRERTHLRVVFLDYYLPGSDPLRCAASVRAHAGPDLPIFLCTAAGRAQERARELELAGALSKPFDIVELEELLASPPKARPRLAVR